MFFILHCVKIDAQFLSLKYHYFLDKIEITLFLHLKLISF
jgi:hypothetical protein